METTFLLRTGFDLNSRRQRGRSWRGGAMETGGQGSFQAVKLQRPARAAVCSHSTKDMAAMRSIKSKLDPKPCSAPVSVPLGTLLSESENERPDAAPTPSVQPVLHTVHRPCWTRPHCPL